MSAQTDAIFSGTVTLQRNREGIQSWLSLCVQIHKGYAQYQAGNREKRPLPHQERFIENI